MPPRVPPSRIAQALEYLQGLKGRAGEMLNTVASTPGTMRPDEYQERFGLPGDPVPAPREVGQTVREAVTRFTSFDAPQNPTFAEMAADTGASFVPGVGQLLAARDIERARRADDPAGMAMAASNFLPVDRLIGALRYGLGKPPISELDVYHGTPHRFPGTEANPLGEFDASKIGTGEGAQAYGHGVYYAENPEVAKGYQPRDSKAEAKLMNLYKQAEARQNYDQMEVLEAAMLHRTASELREQFPKQKGLVTRIGKINEKAAGSLYKADLPDEMIDRMLDWDKPLSQQPENVRKAFDDVMTLNGVESYVPKDTGSKVYFNVGDSQDLMGHQIHNILKENLGGASESVSRNLKDYGIPGIKYLDAGSRGNKGDGTRNFVVFPGEEKKVRILERK